MRLMHAAFAMVMACQSLLASDIRVSQAGDDAAAGDANMPVRTLAKAAELAGPGDRVIVHGGVYRETLRPARSGEAERPIQFVAAEGERVIITGADPLETSGGVMWEAGILRFPTKQRFVQVFIDGQMMPEACFPNREPGDLMSYPRATAGPGTGYETLNDPTLPAADLTGAVIHIWNGERWWSATRKVASSKPGELQFDKTFVPETPDEYHGFDPYKPKAGNPYVVFGHRALLDAPGEWFLDEAAGELLIMPPGAAPLRGEQITVKARELVLDLSERSHVEVKGFEFVAGAPSLADAKDCVVEDCRFTYIEHFREFPTPWTMPERSVVTGSNNEFRRCGFAYSAASALRLRGEGNKLLDSIVHDVNYMGTPQGGVLAGNSQGAVIDSCTIFRTGRDGIMHGSSKRITITHNDISSVCMLNADSGAIYCWGTDGEGSVIAYNRVHDNTGVAVVGIYLDNFSKNFTVHHNISWNNTGAGITLNSDAENHLVANNTLANNGRTFGTYTYIERTPTQRGTRIVNNLVTARIREDDPSTIVQGELGPKMEANGAGAIDAAGVPLPGSPAIDAGIEVRGITDGFVGAAPDLGAIEVGKPPFRSGATWTWAGMPEVQYSSLAWAPLPPITEANMIREGLVAWLDASNLQSLQWEGASLRAWLDQAGTSETRRDAISTLAGGESFSVVENGIGGRPAIKGSGRAVLRLEGMPGALTHVTVIVMAAAPGEPGRPWQRIAGAWTGENRDWIKPNWTMMRPSAETPAPFAPQVIVTSHREPVTLKNFAVFGSMATDQRFEGLIGEVLVYSRALSDEEQSALELYLMNKWGVKD